MKPKKIKSKQVWVDCPAVSCECGDDCYGVETGQAYSHMEDKEYYCDACRQIWILPDNVEMKIVFTKKRRRK